MTTILRTDDLNCPSCVAGLEKMVLGIAGVERARVRFATGRIEVHHAPESVTVEQLIRALGRAGYRVRASVV